MGEHAEKWMKSMIKKHGSEEAVREYMRKASNKSRRNTGKGGFASMSKERRTEISREAARKRWAKNG